MDIILMEISTNPNIIRIVIILVVAVVIALLSVLSWYIRTANELRRKPIEIEQALSNIDVSLAKRADTLRKQLDVTKAYAKHELDTFSAIVNIRKGMTVQELQEASAQMDEIQSRINAVAEAYPELHSSKNFLQLQAAINTCEADLAATRRIYNANVSEFNQMIVQFPTTIVANKIGCQKFASFEATQTQRNDVEMAF